MKKFAALLLVLAMVFSFAACGTKEETTVAETDIFAKSEGVMTYSEYADAALDSEVTVEAFIQSCAYSAAYGNASLFLQDKDGGYYVYRMNVAAEDAEKFVTGAKLQVKGYKSEWAGETEITDATYTFMDGTYVAEAVDATYDFYEEGLAKYPNQLIAVSGVQVEPSLNADGESVPFLYNWDGSGAKGSNNDLYFNVSFHGNVFNLTVESDECPEGSDVYSAVEALAIGDVIDFEGFDYWYNGPNIHVTKVTVATAFDGSKSEGVLTYDEYAALDLDQEVTVEGYVTACAYNSTYGNASFFLQDDCGAYYVYRMDVAAEDATKLYEGVKVQVTGYKSEWAGETEIADVSAYQILDGEYKPAALDVTSLLGTENLEKHKNEFISLTGVTVAASTNPAGEEVAFLYNWDGSGAEGSNNDLYFNIDVNGTIYSLTVESDEYAEGSDTYYLVTQLEVGESIDLEGLLYWYNGPQVHVSKILVK